MYHVDEVRSSEYGAGKVKLELQYVKKQEKLNIMVRHVKDLVSLLSFFKEMCCFSL